MFPCDGFAKALRTELRNRDLGGAEGRSREDGGKVGDVKERGGVEIDSSFSVAHEVVEIVNVRQDICVSQHDAFRPAGCAAGVDQSQNRFWIVKDVGMRIALRL